MNEQALKMILAGKQLEIDKLKRKVKEQDDIIEAKRIDEGGWNSDNTRQRNPETRKKTKRTTKSSDSN